MPGYHIGRCEHGSARELPHLAQAAHGSPADEFLERLANECGYESFGDIDDEHRDEAAVGLAFADIKLRGECDPRARALALVAIERQRRETEAAKKWKHREEQLQALEKIERKLSADRKTRARKGLGR